MADTDVQKNASKSIRITWQNIKALTSGVAGRGIQGS